MKIVTLWAALAMTAATSAGAETLSFAPQPSGAQKLGVASGKPAVQSDGKAVSAVLVLQTESVDDGASPVFMLGVSNAGANPLTVTPKAVGVKADGRTLRLFTAEDLRQAAQDRLEIAKSQLRARTEAKAGAFGQNSDTGYVQTKGGRYLVDQTPQVGSNKKLAADAQARIDDAPAQFALADAVGFKPLTVAPGASAWTPMTFTAVPKSATTLVITFGAGNETHIFTYAVSRQP